MPGSGGPSQVRRRQRRAAAREASTVDEPLEVLTADATDDDAETFAPDGEGEGPAEPYSGTCSCGDMADAHAGEMNDGACSIDGCDCGGFEPMTTTASVEVTTTTTTGNYYFDSANAVLTFTALDGRPLSFPVTETGVEFSGDSPFLVAAVDDEEFAGATNPALPDEHKPKEAMPPTRPHPAAPPGGDAKPVGGDAEAPGDDDADAETPEDENREEDLVASEQGVTGMRWTAMIAPEGTPTDDGRIFAPGAVSWRELPLSLGVMMDTPHADVVTASPVCGRIEKIYRSGNLIMAEGEFDNSQLGQDIARMVSDGTLRGVSVDLAIAKMEIAYKSDILDDAGKWKGGDAPAGDGPDMLDVLFGDSEEEVMFVIWEGTIGAVTICPFPAFADAKIESAKSLVAAANPMVWTVTMQHGMVVVASAAEPEPVEALVAAAALDEAVAEIPVAPSRECFANPEFDGPTALTVEGNRVFGHAAIWGVCHIGIPGVCTTAPSSPSDYAYFHLKEVECDDGERVPCGTITLDTGHADRRLGRLETTRHYDDTGTAVADIVCGEDDFGIWFSGALRSDIDAGTLRKLRGAVLSGDWRAANVSGDLELVALLAVNVPGFPVPRTRAMVASGAEGPHVLALVAAGINDGSVEPMSRAEKAQFEALGDLVAGEFADLASRAQEAAG